MGHRIAISACKIKYETKSQGFSRLNRKRYRLDREFNVLTVTGWFSIL
jgi:hypothetical protein